MENTLATRWFPATRADRRPSPWWYFGRAVYVSRRDYGKIFLAFIALGIPFGAIGVLFDLPVLFRASFVVAAIGLLLLAYSLIGLYRMYGHPARRYFRRLLDLGGVEGPVVVADLHIGTYRHAYGLAEALPEATVHTVDCWNIEGPAPEVAVQDVRALEAVPSGHPRLKPARAEGFRLPLADHSCDAVVFGFGTHEIPEGGPRETLFAEARRVLKAGGRALMFEHGYDFHNYMIFGPVIGHVTRREDWIETFRKHFADVRHVRTSQAVDLYAGRRHD